MQDQNIKPGILQVLPGLNSGGVEREVLDIASGIVKAGFRSYVISSGGQLVKELESQGSIHFNLLVHSKNPWVIYRNIALISKFVVANNINLIHSQSRAPGWSCYFVCKNLKIPFITSIHGAHSTSNKFKIYYNSIVTKGDAIIAVSNFIAQYAKSYYHFDQSKLHVIHCGIDLEKFNPKNISQQQLIDLAKKLAIPLDLPIILLPSRIVRGKGHIFLLNALKLLPKNSFTCLFVGDQSMHPEYVAELKRQVAEYDLSDKVFFIPPTNDMASLYLLSDLVPCVSTKPEAFGLVAAEAQAMGRMVIACNHGGSKEVVKDKVSGWLVAKDDVNELAGVIKYLLQIDPQVRSVNSSNARSNIEENFSLSLMQKKIIEIYSEVLLEKKL